MIQGILITGAVGVALSATTAFFAYGTGKKVERSYWQEAEIEEIAAHNKGLSDHITDLTSKQAGQEYDDYNFGQEIGNQTQQVTERIIQVPVEKIVKVEVPAECDSGDINISYDTIGLFNDWSAGGRLNETASQSTTSDLPLVGANQVSGDATGNGYR